MSATGIQGHTPGLGVFRYIHGLSVAMGRAPRESAKGYVGAWSTTTVLGPRVYLLSRVRFRPPRERDPEGGQRQTRARTRTS